MRVLLIDVDSRIPKRLGACAYLMVNTLAERTPRITALKRWCRPWIFWSCTFEEYDRRERRISAGQRTLEKREECI